MRRTRKPAPSESPVSTLRTWLAPRLLRWFARHQRDLPWRHTHDPYRIWVSEVMLQQTQVATVIPYYHRFLEAFPTLADLAAADEQQVLRLWEGLGYYRRARNLLQAARLLLERSRPGEATIPDDPDLLQGLPGLGTYTRNAVLSQAFDRRLPILEANSQRVLSRLLGRSEDPREGPARRRLWQAAEELLPTRQVGAFNQALMELGSLVCTPKGPRCQECPLAARCQAFQQGKQEEIPLRKPAPAPTAVLESAVVLWRGTKTNRRVFLVQRPEKERWAGLWEFPHALIPEGETGLTAEVRHQTIALLLEEMVGLQGTALRELITIRHSVTRFRITLVCFEMKYRAGEFASSFYQQGRWVSLQELPSYPVSSPQRQLARSLVKEREP